MACQITSASQLKLLTMNVLRAAASAPTLKPDTKWADPPLMFAPQFVGGFYFPLSDAIEAHGCMLKRFSPAICASSDTPQDIIDGLAKELKLN